LITLLLSGLFDWYILCRIGWAIDKSNLHNNLNNDYEKLEPSFASLFVNFRALSSQIEVTEESMFRVYEVFGHLQDVCIKTLRTDKTTGCSVGYVFVSFAPNIMGIQSALQAVVYMQDRSIGGVHYHSEISRNFEKRLEKMGLSFSMPKAAVNVFSMTPPAVAEPSIHQAPIENARGLMYTTHTASSGSTSYITSPPTTATAVYPMNSESVPISHPMNHYMAGRMTMPPVATTNLTQSPTSMVSFPSMVYLPAYRTSYPTVAPPPVSAVNQMGWLPSSVSVPVTMTAAHPSVANHGYGYSTSMTMPMMMTMPPHLASLPYPVNEQFSSLQPLTIQKVIPNLHTMPIHSLRTMMSTPPPMAFNVQPSIFHSVPY
jgi:hypothetical protein